MREGRTVVAVGLDSAPLDLYGRWMDDGTLPVLAALRERGATTTLAGPPVAVAEASWTMLLTGCLPERTGYWGPVPYAAAGGVRWVAAYDYRDYPPFYALGDRYTVAAIDLPQVPVVANVSGIQVVGYGGHSILTEPDSAPLGLLERLIARHGPHPAFNRDFARVWRGDSLRRLYRRLSIGAGRRAAMVADLLREGDWDLFLTVFGEVHAGAHAFWHLNDAAHPWHALARRRAGGDLLEAICRDVDRALGRVIEAAGRDATVVIYTQQNSISNGADLPTGAFLPEALFRWFLPGHAGLAGSPRPGNEPPPPPVTVPPSLGWSRDLWGRRADPSALRRALRAWLPLEVSRAILALVGDDPEGLRFPDDQSVYIHPSAWYAPHWPRMKAFALPSFGDGFVRLNVRGREPTGIVAPEDFATVAEEVRRVVLSLRDARTGQPLADTIVALRDTPFAAASGHPADLAVVWRPLPADVADSPLVGRIGPFPYRRTSGHDGRGFLIAAGPDIAPGTTWQPGRITDVSATLLDLIGAELPAGRDGRSLLRQPVASA
ncbi:hypothetical protein ACM64Y_04485 [Novispirillum sp. DQ9]|uniref:hypothetical protein n=1 Tax=Novispirillum sp. DQ9 TaxID=3398612 RepID=UPI003C7C01B6